MNRDELRKLAGLTNENVKTSKKKNVFTVEMGPKVGHNLDYMNVIVENASSIDEARQSALDQIGKSKKDKYGILKVTEGMVNDPNIDTYYVNHQKEMIEESQTVVKMTAAKNDQEVHNRLKALKKAGIEARAGARNAYTDIIVDTTKSSNAKNVLKKAGFGLVEDAERKEWGSSTLYEGDFSKERMFKIAGVLKENHDPAIKEEKARILNNLKEKVKNACQELASVYDGDMDRAAEEIADCVANMTMY